MIADKHPCKNAHQTIHHLDRIRSVVTNLPQDRSIQQRLIHPIQLAFFKQAALQLTSTVRVCQSRPVVIIISRLEKASYCNAATWTQTTLKKNSIPLPAVTVKDQHQKEFSWSPWAEAHKGSGFKNKQHQHHKETCAHYGNDTVWSAKPLLVAHFKADNRPGVPGMPLQSCIGGPSLLVVN